MDWTAVRRLSVAAAAIGLLAGCAAVPAAKAANITSGVAVTASAFENVAAGGWKDFPPEKTVDGDLDKLSSWRAEAEGEHAGQWIQYDLGLVRRVAFLKVAFLQGDSRIYRFDVLLGVDEEQPWTKVFSGESGGRAGPEVFECDETPARYVRIVGYGNRGVTEPSKFPHWINIVETEIYGR